MRLYTISTIVMWWYVMDRIPNIPKISKISQIYKYPDAEYEALIPSKNFTCLLSVHQSVYLFHHSTKIRSKSLHCLHFEYLCKDSCDATVVLSRRWFFQVKRPHKKLQRVLDRVLVLWIFENDWTDLNDFFWHQELSQDLGFMRKSSYGLNMTKNCGYFVKNLGNDIYKSKHFTLYAPLLSIERRRILLAVARENR